MSPTARGEAVTLFDAVGGEPTFRKLVDEFYAGVATDPLLRPMYPEEDLGPAADRLRLFLMQYWGGPNTYSAQRGHPRLRMRHAPFRIGAAERDAWLRHMRRAVDSARPAAGAAPPTLWDYLERAAYFMVNAMEDPAAAAEPRGGHRRPSEQGTLVVQPVDETRGHCRAAVEHLDQERVVGTGGERHLQLGVDRQLPRSVASPTYALQNRRVWFHSLTTR